VKDFNTKSDAKTEEARNMEVELSLREVEE